MKTSDAEIGFGVMLLRQLHGLVSAGHDLKTAGARLRENLARPMQQRLDALLAAFEAPDGDARTAHQVIITEARKHGADPLASVLRFSGVTERLGVVQRRLREAFKTSSTIFIGTGLVAIAIILLTKWALVPFFASIYGSLDPVHGWDEFPLLTRVMFLDGGGWFSLLLAVLLAVMIAGILKLMVDTRRAFGALEPVPAYWQRIPVIRRLAARIQHTTIVVVAESLRGGGLSASAALEAAAASVGETLGDATAIEEADATPEHLALALARDTGNLEHELEWQALNLPELLDADFSGLLRNLQTAMTTMVSVIVGLLVVSIYLPIFRLGSVGSM